MPIIPILINLCKFLLNDLELANEQPTLDGSLILTSNNDRDDHPPRPQNDEGNVKHCPSKRGCQKPQRPHHQQPWDFLKGDVLFIKTRKTKQKLLLFLVQ